MDKSKVSFQAGAKIPTEYGTFMMKAYASSSEEPMPHLALINDTHADIVNVRIHSECMTGDVFGSNRCECGEQLEKSLQYLGENGGILIYLRQEGRGIGLINKLHAYIKQDEGYDTAEANIVLGHVADGRNYDVGLRMLEDLGVKKIKLLTNNPEKISAFDSSSIEVIERIPLQIDPKQENAKYLETKKHTFGHLIK